MALVDCEVLFGADLNQLAGPSITSILNDAASEAWAFSFQVPLTGTIEAVVFRAGTVTSFQDMTISLETVGTDGLPSGSNYGSSTAGTWTGGSSNTSPEVTLGTSATATIGDLVCVRGEWAGSAGNLNVNYLFGASASSRRFPKVLPDTGSGFVLTTGGKPMICLKYSGGIYVVPRGCAPPLSALTTVNTSSSSSPQEIGFWLTPNVKAMLAACSVPMRTYGTTSNNTVAIYTTPAGTPSSQRSFTANHNQVACVGHHQTFSWNPYEVAASTDYVIGFLQSSVSSIDLTVVDVADANHWGGWAGGSNLVYASRNSGGGAFTKTTTRKILGNVFFSQIDDGAGGGGLITHPGMSGGMRG